MRPEAHAASPAVTRAFEGYMSPQMLGRNCHLAVSTKIKVESIRVQSDIIAYASPDSTYAVTRRLLDVAKRSVLIGIYDFTAGYVKELLIKALRRGVGVSLMLDLDNRSGETPLFEELVRNGVEGVPAPSCASDHARYFPSSHEKVIVIDDQWSLVQSGNYCDSSIPQNEEDDVADPATFVPGNRDMGVAIRSRGLAEFFTTVSELTCSWSLTAPVGRPRSAA
jgi:phosphatidylserine/phosphatidylglycerophosphate/cardiolipin synthase-like enzyme